MRNCTIFSYNFLLRNSNCLKLKNPIFIMHGFRFSGNRFSFRPVKTRPEPYVHKVHIYLLWSTAMYVPLVGWVWDSPTPSPASECAPPPEPKGGGVHTRLRVRGWGSPNSAERVCPHPRNQREGAHSNAGEGVGESQFCGASVPPSQEPKGGGTLKCG
jgi:hypothetical protein